MTYVTSLKYHMKYWNDKPIQEKLKLTGRFTIATRLNFQYVARNDPMRASQDRPLPESSACLL